MPHLPGFLEVGNGEAEGLIPAAGAESGGDGDIRS